LDSLLDLLRAEHLLILLHCKNQLFHYVLEELTVFSPGNFRFLNPRVNTEQTCLIKLLRLNECGDPVLLSFLKILDNLLLVHKVLFIFGEVLCANIFNLVKFLIILFLQVLSMLISSRRRRRHKRLDILALLMDFLLQLNYRVDEARLRCASILSLNLLDLDELLVTAGHIRINFEVVMFL